MWTGNERQYTPLMESGLMDENSDRSFVLSDNGEKLRALISLLMRTNGSN